MISVSEVLEHEAMRMELERKIPKLLKGAEWTADGATKYRTGRAYPINLFIYDKLYLWSKIICMDQIIQYLYVT